MELAFLPSIQWTVLEQPVVVSHGILIFRQATLQQLLKVTICFVDIRFKLFLQPVSRIVHYAVP